MTKLRTDIAMPSGIEVLRSLDRSALIKAWVDHFGTEPPKHLSIIFMQKVLSWEYQCKAGKGISHEVRRAMKAKAEGQDSAGRSIAISSGSQLVREWNGRRYQVDVQGDQYVLDGRTYASLTAVAKHITGTNWSGPRFFGLTKAKKAIT